MAAKKDVERFKGELTVVVFIYVSKIQLSGATAPHGVP